MISIQQAPANPVEERVLRSMFEARKQVFRDLLKWDVTVLEDRFEIDQFDNEHSTYVIVADEAGAHLASARLLETTRPHILGNLFPGLCANAVPTGPHIYEITRFCLDRRQSAKERKIARNRLISALVRFALDRGIKTYTGVADMRWLQQVLAFGWDCRPLGLPQRLACGLTGALAISIGTDTPALLEANGIWVDEDQVLAVAA